QRQTGVASRGAGARQKYAARRHRVKRGDEFLGGVVPQRPIEQESGRGNGSDGDNSRQQTPVPLSGRWRRRSACHAATRSASIRRLPASSLKSTTTGRWSEASRASGVRSVWTRSTLTPSLWKTWSMRMIGKWVGYVAAIGPTCEDCHTSVNR